MVLVFNSQTVLMFCQQGAGIGRGAFRQISAPAVGRAQSYGRPHSVVFSRQAANPVILRDFDKPMLGVTSNRLVGT